MPDAVAQALATPGLGWLALAILIAGAVRGFSGFGSAMIIMPVASSVLDPVAAVTFLIVTDLIGPVLIFRGVVRDADRGDLFRLGLGALLAMPVGVYALSRMSTDVFSWVVSVVVIVLLAFLVTGWRYRGALTRPLVLGTGALGGLLAGGAGVGGPPAIMLYLASTKPNRVVRANLALYLLTIDLMMLGLIAAYGLLQLQPFIIGLAMCAPYMAASWAGAVVFARGGVRQFRAAAYVIIAASAVIGLPVW